MDKKAIMGMVITIVSIAGGVLLANVIQSKVINKKSAIAQAIEE
jgi:flagellar motor component MotA